LAQLSQFSVVKTDLEVAMGKRPVLVIDDDRRSSELVSAILTVAGFEVRSAHDGPSGIEMARAVQPAAILLDMMMPGIDGITTLQRLKWDPILADIPVIGMTASSDLSYTGKAFRAGADFFVPKPLNRAALIRAVELAVDKVLRGAPMRDHRRHPRFQSGIAVRCLVGADANSARKVMGSAGNVSLGGLLLILPEPLMPGTPLGLSLELPESAIPAAGKVMWQNPQRMVDGRVRHGIQLARFASDSGLMGYRRYLSQVAATESM
jgi:CheY-like chemotaxis protein